MADDIHDLNIAYNTPYVEVWKTTELNTSTKANQGSKNYQTLLKYQQKQ
jgi:hypothetical protein